MTTNKQFFVNLMAQHGVSMRSVATQMGLGHSQLSQTFNSKRRMQLEEAAHLAKIFGVPLATIAEAAGISLGRVPKLPLIGFMNGKGEVEAFAKKERTHAPDGLPEDAIAIQARTADSANAWLDGWNFYCQPPAKTKAGQGVATDALGRFCYAQVDGGPLVLATVRRGYQPGTYNLSGPYTAESVSLRWAVPVLVARS